MNRLTDTYRKIPIQAKLTIWTFVCMVLQRSVSLLTVPIFTRMLTTEQYGQYSVYMSWINIFSIFTSLRLYDGVYSKGMSKYKDDRDGYALSMQYTTSFLTLGVLVVYLLFSKWINAITDLTSPLMLLMIVELFFMTPMQFWTVRQRFDFRYKSVVVATLILTLASPIVGIIAVTASEDKGVARIISTALVQVCIGGFFYVLNLRKGKYKFNREYAKFALLFNIPLIPHYLSEYLLNQSDRVMIQKLCGYSEAAVYSVAFNVGMVMTIVSSSINQALVPWMYQTLDTKGFSKIKKQTFTLGIFVASVLGIFVLSAPELTYIMGGAQYSLAKYIIPPVAVAVYFSYWYILFVNVEFYYDKNKYTMYISMAGALLNIVLNYIFIQTTSFIAAAYTSLFCHILYTVAHYVLMQRVFHKKENASLFNIKGFSLVGLCLIIFMAVAMLLYEHPIARYGMVVVAGSIAFINRKRLIELITSIKKKRAN